MRMLTPTTESRPAGEASSTRHGIVQRCECGGKAGPTGQCAQCRREQGHGLPFDRVRPVETPPFADGGRAGALAPRSDPGVLMGSFRTGPGGGSTHQPGRVSLQRQPVPGRASSDEEPEQEEEGRRELEEDEGAGSISTLGAQLKRWLVSRPGDVYEREADRVANDVVQRDSQDPLVALYRSGLSPHLAASSRRIQRIPRVDAAPSVDIDLGQSGGRPLGSGVRRYMEGRFGYSFEKVRIHDNARSHRLARQLHAHAFTVGRDIYFDRGEYRPSARDGKRLLAHELTHVVQQGQAELPGSGDGGLIPMDTVQRAMKMGVISRSQLMRMPRASVRGPVEHTRAVSELQPGARGGVADRQISRTGDTRVQLSNGGHGGRGASMVRAEASFAEVGPLNLYRGGAFVEASPDDTGCKFVDGSVTGDKTMVGGFTVSVGLTTERGPSTHQADDEACESNDGKRDWVRYYLHFSAVQGIGVSVSKTAGVSGTWITAQHDHTVDLRIYPNGRANAVVNTRRTKGPGGDRIRREVDANGQTGSDTITL